MTVVRLSPETKRIMDIWHSFEDGEEDISVERLWAMTMDTAAVSHDEVMEALVEWMENGDDD